MLDVVSGAQFELGVTRLFGDCDLGSTGLISGWATPEQAHCWNDGVDTTFEFEVMETSGSFTLTFEAEPFLNERCPSQDVCLYVNGFRIGFWRLKEAQTYQLCAPIEREQLFDRAGMMTAKCVWHIPNSARPLDIGLGADIRELGLCFRSMTFAESR